MRAWSCAALKNLITQQFVTHFDSCPQAAYECQSPTSKKREDEQVHEQLLYNKLP